jgi:exopolysaccharide biosynthesis polyprenyl glycosylphosphotransferase
MKLRDAPPPAARPPFETSFRGALDEWDIVSQPHLSGGKSLSPSVWRVFLLVLDIITWGIAGLVSLGILVLVANGSSFPSIYVVIIPVVISILATGLVGGYDRDTDFASLRFASETLIAGLFASFLGAGLAALFGSYGAGTQTSRFFLFATPMFYTIGSLGVRRLTWRFTKHGFADLRLIVVGTLDEASRLEHALTLVGRPLRVLQIQADHAVDGDLAALLRAPELGKETTSPRDTIVIAPSAATALTALSPFLVSLHASSVPVYSWSAFWSQRVKIMDWGSDSSEWFFAKDFRLSSSSTFSNLKRVSDIIFASFALVLTAPICLLTAVLIRLDSRGPAIFRQDRVGLRGKIFTIYKFRTMTLNSERAGTTTTKNDARITRLGNLLRKFRIDEIPQLINVVKGDMSIVGPRPEWTVCVEDYEHQLPGYHLRHLAKPGITGWAQVNYPYGEGVEDARNKLAFDLFYVAHPSFILDCSIVLKTVYVLLGRIGGR